MKTSNYSLKSFAAEKNDGEIAIYKELLTEDLKSPFFKVQNSGTGTTQTEPEAMELPRKANNFRVLMERKLGIDYEHSPDEES